MKKKLSFRKKSLKYIFITVFIFLRLNNFRNWQRRTSYRVWYYLHFGKLISNWETRMWSQYIKIFALGQFHFSLMQFKSTFRAKFKFIRIRNANFDEFLTNDMKKSCEGISIYLYKTVCFKQAIKGIFIFNIMSWNQ